MKQKAYICGPNKNDDKILATQRGYGELKGGWEFPGGKREGRRGGTSVNTLKEHSSAKWLAKDELNKIQWLPADKEITDTLLKIV